jgi:hypothetical protein
MNYLLKHKILQFVFKCLNVHSSAPACFGPLGPSSGSTYQNLAKVTKITVFLKYQLKHLVKIVVLWCIKISACGVYGREAPDDGQKDCPKHVELLLPI